MTTSTLTAELSVPLLPGSSMAALHRESGPLRRALTTIPEWVDGVEALNHLNTIRPPHRNLATLDVEMEVLLTDAVEKRAPLDVDQVLAHAGKVQDNLAANHALNRAFEITAGTLVQRLDATVRDHQADLYAHLSGQLNTVVQEARQHTDMFNLDAAGAIAAGAVDRWQRLGGLRAQARALRAARGTLEQRLGWTDEYSQYPELRWLANPAQVYSQWRAWKVDGYLVNPHDMDDRKPLTAPWPDPRRERLDTASECDAWLSFLARTPAATPWIPNPSQYVAAAKDLFAHASSLRPGDTAGRYVEPPSSPVTYGENKRPAPRKAGVLR